MITYALLVLLTSDVMLSEADFTSRWTLTARRQQVVESFETGFSGDRYNRTDPAPEGGVGIHGKHYWWYQDWSTNFDGASYSRDLPLTRFELNPEDDVYYSTGTSETFTLDLTLDPWGWNMDEAISVPRSAWLTDPSIVHTAGFEISDVRVGDLTGTLTLTAESGASISEPFLAVPELQPERTYIPYPGKTPHTLDSPPGFFSIVDPDAPSIARDDLVFHVPNAVWTGTLEDVDFRLTFGAIESGLEGIPALDNALSLQQAASIPEPSAFLFLGVISLLIYWAGGLTNQPPVDL